MIFWLKRLLGLVRRRWADRQRVSERVAAKEAGSDTAANTETNPAPLDFSEQLERSKSARSSLERGLELEVSHLRKETQQLRAEVTQLAVELRQLKIVHNTSPMYAEAVTLAQQGLSTADIADRCGISLGEAELVAALAQSETKGGYDEKK